MRERAGRIAFYVGAVVSALMLVYVAYVHVLSASGMAGPAPRDFREGFGAQDGLPAGYGVRQKGELAWAAKGGVISVSGRGKAGDEVVFTTPARRLEDSLVSVRFRAKGPEPVEVFLGLEQQEVKRAVNAAFVAGPASIIHAGGDVSGPYRSATVVEDVPVTVEPGAWHLLSLQFSPRYNTGVVLLDGKPALSVGVLWSQATLSKIAFGVRVRGETSEVGVEIESLAFQALDLLMASFDDTFNGEILDTQRWIIHYPDANLASFAWHLEKKQGLVLEASARAVLRDSVPFYFVRTPPFPLRTLRASADVTIDAAKHGRLYFGLLGSSAWTTMDKVFDVGVSEHEQGTNVDVSGAWNNTGTLSFETRPSSALPSRHVFEIRYDAATGLGTGLVDGTVIAAHPLDLKALDMVSVRLGAGGYGIDAKTRVTVHRISLEMR